MAIPADVVVHAQQSGGSSVVMKDICLGLQVIWMTTIWVVWKECNARISTCRASIGPII